MGRVCRSDHLAAESLISDFDIMDRDIGPYDGVLFHVRVKLVPMIRVGLGRDGNLVFTTDGRLIFAKTT